MVRDLMLTGWRSRLSEERPEDRRALLTYQRRLAQSALAALRKFLSIPTVETEQKDEARKDMTDAIRAVFSK